jgi:hypothetical protein
VLDHDHENDHVDIVKWTELCNHEGEGGGEGDLRGCFEEC